MIGTIAWKSLVAHPVRTAVLSIGFGLGVGVMATLLGVGEVVLEQARAPALAGGGDVVVTGISGSVTSARFVLDALSKRGRESFSSTASDDALSPENDSRPLFAASPRRRADLFLVGPGGIVPVLAKGGIPSLERALGNPETAGVEAWLDTPADAAWTSPEPGEMLRAMDRFHPVPDVPARADSWAEWLYFKGRSGEVQFYVTFLAGPQRPGGRRAAGVRLQLDRGGRVTTYSESVEIDEATLLASAPDLTIGGSRVRLEGLRYHLTLDLPDATGDIVIEAAPGRSLPPFAIRGAGGWVSGYVVPVTSGTLTGSLTVGGQPITLAGTGYHDHNWGFWEGVSWRWGQVQHEGLSYVYGRIYPPADAADAERIPALLVAVGPDGPVGFSRRVTITETNDPATGMPRRILVRGRGGDLDLQMEIEVESAIVTRGGPLAGGPDFLQLRVRYHVTGEVGDQAIDFTAPGAAETFRGR